MSALQTIAVVGGSLAGLRGAEALRRLGYEGRLVFVGAEPHRPYDRPPLSKEVLRGEREAEQIGLARPDAFEGLELDLRLGRRATALDPAGRRLELDDGEQVRFDGLLIATGAAPRRLPGAEGLSGVHLLRSLDDALALRAELLHGPRVAVVGAGFIGSEVAASCRRLGLEVTVVETLPLPLVDAVGREVAEVLAAVHRDHGVTLRLGVPVEGFEGGPRVQGLRLADGTRVAADLVVVGIGVSPETAWLESSGLPLEDGVLCDASCAVAPGIVAAGDVARWPNRLFEASMRLEHWTNAVEQANAAAERLLAGASGAQPYAPVPFVWSDQYDVKLQSAGVVGPRHQVRIVHGTARERRFVALYGHQGRLTGAVALNRVRHLMGYRRQIRQGIGFEEAVEQARGAPSGGSG